MASPTPKGARRKKKSAAAPKSTAPPSSRTTSAKAATVAQQRFCDGPRPNELWVSRNHALGLTRRAVQLAPLDDALQLQQRCGFEQDRRASDQIEKASLR